VLTFHYQARNAKTGEKVEGDVDADSEQGAVRLIRQEGLSPIEVTPATVSSGLAGRVKNYIGTKDRILFSRQLSTLINAGLPLIQSLRSVGNQTQNKAFKTVINRIIGDVEAGSALSVALAKHPKVFNQIYISLIAAGETSGTLDKSLERLALQQEKDAEIISKVRGAMVYPLVVIIVMLGVVGFMIVKVLPQVEVLYEGLPGAQLPLVTRILLGLSHLATKYWWAVLTLIVVLSIFTSRWARTFGGKRVIDRLKMKIWPIGPLFMKMYMARFARTGSTLVASGVPLIQMLEITGASVNNIHIEDSLKAATEKVKGGKSLSESIQNDPNFLSLVPDMLKIGEQSGAIEQMLEKTADYYEKEVDNQIKTVSTIIEPVLMVILGVFAFIIVAAVLLPVYGLAGKSLIR
jgi:type IV pilus assembly protein PilC